MYIAYIDKAIMALMLACVPLCTKTHAEALIIQLIFLFFALVLTVNAYLVNTDSPGLVTFDKLLFLLVLLVMPLCESSITDGLVVIAAELLILCGIMTQTFLHLLYKEEKPAVPTKTVPRTVEEFRAREKMEARIAIANSMSEFVVACADNNLPLVEYLLSTGKVTTTEQLIWWTQRYEEDSRDIYRILIRDKNVMNLLVVPATIFLRVCQICEPDDVEFMLTPGRLFADRAIIPADNDLLMEAALLSAAREGNIENIRALRRCNVSRGVFTGRVLAYARELKDQRIVQALTEL